MAISIIQHRAAITKKVIASVQEIKGVKSGFANFFPSETTPSRQVAIEVERGSDLIAVDVQIFGDGNLNKSSKSTEKIFVPPYFQEGYNFSQEAIYDVTFGAGQSPSKAAAGSMVRKARTEMKKNKDKILRAILKQQADVLQTGVVKVKNGDSIDFKRKAASMVALGAGVRWNEAGSDPLADLQKGGLFIREEGNSSSTAFNVVMGGDAFAAFMNNEKIKEQAEWINIRRENIGMPQFDNVTGMTFQGQMGTNDYRINIWTYSEKYTTVVGGAPNYYLDPKNVVMLPDDFQGKTVFGAVPGMIGSGENAMPTAIEADFYTYSYVDRRKKAKMFEISSAPLVVPFTIDRIYSLTVLA